MHISVKFTFQAVTNTLRIIKLLRLLRLGKVMKKIERFLKYGSVTLAIWILFFSLIGHWMACIWYAYITDLIDYTCICF